MRIYTSTSDPIDFCRQHAPGQAEAIGIYGDVGEGPDDRGNCYAYDAEHPPYDDGDDRYTCETCGCKLTSKD